MSDSQTRVGAPPVSIGAETGGRVDLVVIPRSQVTRLQSDVQGTRRPAGAGDDLVYVFPASYDQERLLFVELYEPGATYNVPMPIPFPGAADVPALERTLRSLIERHETLRTSFGFIDRRPVQVVSRDAAFTLEVVDVRDRPEASRRGEIARISAQHAREPFDLLRGPLWRARLLRGADGGDVLLLNFHHSITDLWSTQLLFYELVNLYAGFSQGQSPQLAPQPLQFGDFAAWQRAFLAQGDTLDSLRSFWRAQLAGAPQVLALPSDRPRSSARTSAGDDWLFPLGAEMSRMFIELCQRQRVTIFQGMVTVLGVLLAHYADVEDLLIGTPMSNRTLPGLDGVFGMFVNTVVLRIRPARDVSFGDLLRQVQIATLDAFDHQELPFGLLVDDLVVERNISHSPLFQVMIAHQNDALSGRPMPSHLPDDIGDGMRVTGGTGTTKYDLVLSVIESDRGLLGAFEYSLDLFDEPTIRRLGMRYRQLLAAAVAAPQRTVAQLRQVIADADRAEPVRPTASSAPPRVVTPPASSSAVVRSATASSFAPTAQRPVVSAAEPASDLDRQIGELLAGYSDQAIDAALSAAVPSEASGTPSFPSVFRHARPVDQLTDAEVDDELARLLWNEELSS